MEFSESTVSKLSICRVGLASNGFPGKARMSQTKWVLVTVVSLSLVGCAAIPPDPVAANGRAASVEATSTTVEAEAPIRGGPRIEKPPTFHQGYQLTFSARTSHYEVTYQGEQDGLLVFHFETKETLPFDYLYTPDLKLSGITTSQEQTRFDPPVGYVDFPLFIGKKWKVAYKATSNARHSMDETSVEVMAFEPVRVPYGTVDAFRITVRHTDREVSRMNVEDTYWYSPNIGYFVKHETAKPFYKDPYELTAVSK